MLTLNDGRSELWQWDTGRTLSVDADCSQVHFSNKVFGRSIDVDVTGGVAIIPDVLLQADKDLNVWAFVGTAENGYTKIRKTFKVNRRNKPADYVFTPPDQTSLEEIKEKIDYLESKFATDIPSVDDTLTQSGQAADAKATGDALRSLSEDIVTTAASQVSAHNTGTDTHNDIRLLIQGLTDRLNTLADSDDTTLDQLSEVVAYIKSNRSLIEAITTSKVSVADIVDNLTTNIANKPLSAAQGVALKALIDEITVPDKLPNPNALTFTGAATGTYDGSAPLEVAIPSGGGASGDYIPIPASAEVGQTIVVKAVDEDGKPTEWEAADITSGGGSDGWTEIGEITLEGTEFIISAYSDGIVTISPENGVYPQVNKNTVLRKSDYSSYVNVRFVATGTDGQYTMKNLDGAVYAPSDDLTQYVVDVPSADSISFSNIPEFSFFKAIITTPILSANGLRATIMSSYGPFNLTDGNSAYISGGAAELVYETEDSPIAGKIYSKISFKGKSASRTNGYDIIRMVDRPTAPANIRFTHYNELLTIGTKVKLWGRN